MERKSTHPVAAVAAVAAVAVPAVAAVATVLPTSSCHGLGGFAFHGFWYLSLATRLPFLDSFFVASHAFLVMFIISRGRFFWVCSDWISIFFAIQSLGQNFWPADWTTIFFAIQSLGQNF